MIEVNEEETNEFSRVMVNMLDEIIRNMEINNNHFIMTFGIENLLDDMTLQNIMGASMEEENEKTLPKKDNVELRFSNTVYKKKDCDESCCVCLMDFENGEFVDVCDGCGCVNHHDCMNEWVKRKIECPTCRKCLIDKTYIKDDFTKFVEDELDI
tara:strand:- start:279 stop:743 length:465 start_codon:yes stop_codon:yes gene_type:complete